MEIIAKAVKEKYGALRDEETVFGVAPTMTYELPDGSQLEVEDERFRCAESLFDPSVITSLIPSLAEEYSVGFSSALFETINSCAEEIRNEIYGGIILSGGNTLFPGNSPRVSILHPAAVIIVIVWSC